jgi:hypothetical protein
VRCSKRGPRTRRRALLGACALRLLGRPEAPVELDVVCVSLARRAEPEAATSVS